MTASAALIAWVVLQFAASSAHAAEYAGDPAGYQSVLQALRPGDTLTLRPGVYRHGLWLHDMHGEPGRPIVIQGMREGPSAVMLGRGGASTVSLADASYITIRDLRIDGAHLPVDAVKAEHNSSSVHHITLERLTIVNYDFNQGTIGISTKCPAWGWVIRDNAIIRGGTGMYLGDSDGSAAFSAGIIEGNLVIDSIGYDVEIKHQINRPDLPGAPDTPSVTLLRYNVFAKSHNAATGKAARPNLLVGHFPLRGRGMHDRYDITSNIFFDNATEALFQGEGNVILAGNIFFNPRGEAIAVRPHNDLPRDISIADNFVAASGRGIAVLAGAPDHVQEVVGNAVYAGEGVTGGAQRDNVFGTFAQASPALKPWLGAQKDSNEAALDRSRLTLLFHRACARPAGAIGHWQPWAQSASPHPLCGFLRTLANDAK